MPKVRLEMNFHVANLSTSEERRKNKFNMENRSHQWQNWFNLFVQFQLRALELKPTARLSKCWLSLLESNCLCLYSIWQRFLIRRRMAMGKSKQKDWCWNSMWVLLVLAYAPLHLLSQILFFKRVFFPVQITLCFDFLCSGYI